MTDIDIVERFRYRAENYTAHYSTSDRDLDKLILLHIRAQDTLISQLRNRRDDLEGWRLVPIEPTQKMLMKVQLKQSAAGYDPQDAEWLRDVYRAMLSASPSPPIPEDPGK